jgi:DNA-binding IclR family transcriptional regulator
MNNYIIPNLVKALDVLRLLAVADDGLSSVEIEEKFALPQTTAFRILKTLMHEGLVQKRKNRFFADTGLYKIGLSALDRLEIRKEAVPILKKVTDETGFTSHLAIPSGKRALIVEVCDSSSPVLVASRPGTRAEMHCCATGKVFLGCKYLDQIDEIYGTIPLTKRTANTITNLKKLKKAVSEIAIKGYAVDDCEYHDDVRCLAAPVRDFSGQVTAALGITAPVTAFTKAKIPQVSQQVVKAADELSAILGVFSS